MNTPHAVLNAIPLQENLHAGLIQHPTSCTIRIVDCFDHELPIPYLETIAHLGDFTQPKEPIGNGNWTHFCTIIAAPEQPVYRGEALQCIMEEMIAPLYPPQMMDRFYDYPEKLVLGKLYFDTYGTEADNRRFARRTWLRLYPSISIAQAAVRGAYPFEIQRAELEGYRLREQP